MVTTRAKVRSGRASGDVLSGSLRWLVDAAPKAVVIQRADGTIALVNRQAEELFGYSEAELCGRPVELLLGEGSRDSYLKERAALLRADTNGASRHSVELESLDKSGRCFSIELELTSVKHGGARFVVNTIRDIAARRHRDLENEALFTATASLGLQAEPEAVLRALVEQAAALVGAERALYAVLQNGRIVIRGRWLQQKWVDDHHEPRRSGILASVWKSGRPFRSNNVGAEPRANRSMVEQRSIRSQMTVPLVAPDIGLMGFVSLHNSRQPEGFSERDERIMVAICQTGAAILRRAQDGAARVEAEQAAARRAREVEALLTVAERLNAAADPDDVLLQVVEVAAELVGVQRVSIVSNEGDYALHRFDWRNGSWERTSNRLPLDGSFSGWVIAHAQSYRSDDASSDPIGFSPLLERYGTLRVLAVPVISRSGQVMSVLILSDRLDGAPFTDDDQRLAEGISHHASVALERATLVQQLRDRERHLHHQAVTDPLTGLPNRRLFLDRLGHALTHMDRLKPGVAVLFLDLDRFKYVNDSLGHAAGDTLLNAVAQRLVHGKRGNDTVARFGGDEFAILLTKVSDVATAVGVAERIVRGLERPFSVKGRERVVISASVGVAIRTSAAGAELAEELLREADIALYQAKAAATGQVAVFEASMGVCVMQKLALHVELQRALHSGEFRLYYQPLIRLDTRERVGMEALLRWQHPRRGLLLPAEFLAVAEETGLILPIGRWVLKEACRQAALWQTLGSGAEPFRICVNLSGRQFEQPDLADQVAAALKEAALDPGALELEITETAVIRNLEGAIVTLRSLRELGVRVALDDFGTGYSSLSYLQQLPVDTLKIDQSFVSDLHEHGTTAAIVQAAATMAHALGVEVTAEGIETEEQLSAIAKLGCDLGQGYLLSVPLPADEANLALQSSPADSRRQSLHIVPTAG